MGVLITGMHRSCTSMVAQWVDELGVGTGGGERFPIDSANPRGLHERKDVVAFNDDWLAELGGSWWAPPRVWEQTWRSLNQERLAEDRQLLDYFDADFHDWYVKDPRLSLLLPLWDRLALQRLPVVIALREPREVAMSLNVRSGITLRRGLALWLAYNRSLFTHLGGRHSLVVDTNSAMQDPYRAVVEVAMFCESSGVTIDSALVNPVAEGIEPGLLRNQTHRLGGSAERFAADVDDIYHALARRHLQPDSDAPENVPLPDWAGEALEELTEVWNLQERIERLEETTQRQAKELWRAYNRLPRRAARVVVPKRLRADPPTQDKG